MFENVIRNTPFVGSLADCMFRRINGSNYLDDTSFLSTLRALLMQRMPSDSSLKFECRTFSYNVPADTCSSMVASVANNENTFAVIACNVNPFEDGEQEKENFHNIAVPEGYREMNDVRMFFAEKMDCRVFINESLHSVVFMILELTLRKYHLIQCVIPKLLPWFFADNRINVQERDLLLSLREKMSSAYERALNAISESDFYRQLSTNSMLTAFKQKSLEKQKRSIERSISEINSRIESLNRDILVHFRNLNDENFKLNGVLAALNDDIAADEALNNFLTANRCVEILGYSDDYLRIAIKGYLDVYDPEAYRTLARNTHSWYWDYAPTRGVFAPASARKKLLDAIFGNNPVFKIKTVGVFRLDVTNGEVAARSNSGDYNRYMDDYHPNPHLYYNGCLGAHRAPINRALSKGDLIGAIAQCISSAHSVNVTESASFRYTVRGLFTEEKPVLEGPDGLCYTPSAALQYLNNLEANEQ